MKTASTGSLTVLAVAALLSAPVAIIWAILWAVIWAGPGAADSIGAVYNMDRMLSEPHPLADQYGTHWQAPPAPPPNLTPGAPRTPVAAPSPFPATAPEPPPTTFAPPEPPPLGQTAPPLPPSPPAPQPVPLARPVAKVTPVESSTEPAPPLVMVPRLSIDAEGVDLEPEDTKPEGMEKAQPEAVDKRFEQPGPRPPLPPG